MKLQKVINFIPVLGAPLAAITLIMRISLGGQQLHRAVSAEKLEEFFKLVSGKTPEIVSEEPKLGAGKS